MDSLEYDAALEMLKTHRHSTDPVLIEMLCGVLGLPLPGEGEEIAFIQEGDVPTVNDVRVTYEEIREQIEDYDEGRVAMTAADDDNERLAIYYLTATKEDIEWYAKSVVEILLKRGKTDGARYIIERFNVVPSLSDLQISYRRRDDVSDTFRFWLLSLINIKDYEEERPVLNDIFWENPSEELLKALVDRLLEVEGYREGIQSSFNDRPLTPFTYQPISLRMVRFFEGKGFDVIKGHYPYVAQFELSGILSHYTGDTDDDTYLWNYLIDELDATPDYQSLDSAAEKGNLTLVKLLIEEDEGEPVKPSYYTFAYALNGSHIDVADYIFPLVGDDIKEKLDFSSDRHEATEDLGWIDNIEAMGIFLNNYWHLSIADISAALQELYDELYTLSLRQIKRGEKTMARLLYNLLRSIGSDYRRALLQLHSSGSAEDVWIRERILEVMDDV